MKAAGAVAATVALYLVAAKAHGRQLRLERELAGYWKVVFGGDNPVFVQELWRRERLYFWGLALLLAVGAAVYAAIGPRLGWPQPLAQPGSRSVWGVILMAVAWPQIVAFALTGAASLVRFAMAPDRPDWSQAALWGSALWWSLALALGAVLGFALRARAA